MIRYQYRMLNMIETDTQAHALDIDDNIVFTANSADKVKAWIDREWRKMQLPHVVSVSGDYVAHYAGMGIWVFRCGNRSMGEIETDTTRKRRDDLSGEKQWRVVTKTEAAITLYFGRDQFKIDRPMIVYGNDKAAVAEILAAFDSGCCWTMIRSELEIKARNSGASELAILNQFDTDDKTHCKNLFRLAQANG